MSAGCSADKHLEAENCGALSIEHLFALHGKQVSISKINGLLGPGSRHSMLELSKVSKQLGLPLVGWHCSIAQLKAMHSPAILYIDRDHFIVAERLNQEDITYWDGQESVATISAPYSWLRRHWDGDCLVATSTGK